MGQQGIFPGASAFCFFNASHAARCVARHGVRSQADPVALVGESIAVVALAVKERPD